MNSRFHAVCVIVSTLSLVAGVSAPMLLGSTTYASFSTSGTAGATFRLDIPTERECAVWAGADFLVHGSRNRFDQCTHANDDVILRGGHHRFKGGVRYVGILDSNNNQHVLERGADKIASASPPVALNLADYAPGGRAALAAGSAYYSYAPKGDGEVSISVDELAPGLHYVSGDVVLEGPGKSVAVTIVATGDIEVESDGVRFTPFIDGLVLGAWDTGKAIEIESDGAVFDGLVYAARGSIRFAEDSDNNVFSGKLVAAVDVRIDGDDNVVSV